MDMTQTIVVLTAANSVAEEACRLEHNADFLLPASCPEQTIDTSRPQKTPIVLPNQLALHLTFARKPCDPLRGYVFGADQERCDVLINAKGTSGVHLRLDFNYDSRSLLLFAEARHGVRIQMPSDLTWTTLERSHSRMVPAEHTFVMIGLALYII